LDDSRSAIDEKECDFLGRANAGKSIRIVSGGVREVDGITIGIEVLVKGDRVAGVTRPGVHGQEATMLRCIKAGS